MTTIKTMSPSPPLGPYPQLRLCGHLGIAPNSIRIKTISRTVPSIIVSLCYLHSINRLYAWIVPLGHLAYNRNVNHFGHGGFHHSGVSRQTVVVPE